MVSEICNSEKYETKLQVVYVYAHYTYYYMENLDM